MGRADGLIHRLIDSKPIKMGYAAMGILTRLICCPMVFIVPMVGVPMVAPVPGTGNHRLPDSEPNKVPPRERRGISSVHFNADVLCDKDASQATGNSPLEIKTGYAAGLSTQFIGYPTGILTQFNGLRHEPFNPIHWVWDLIADGCLYPARVQPSEHRPSAQ